jgi:hypothetical protein
MKLNNRLLQRQVVRTFEQNRNNSLEISTLLQAEEYKSR